MSGHNRWSKVRHQKEAQGALKGRRFEKLLREIAAAARAAGPDPAHNARLRAALEAAHDASVPREKIEAAVARAAGKDGGGHDEEALYEGYGPGGVAVLVECLTDSRNRTAADVRARFEKAGGHLAAQGAVAWHFEKAGTFDVKPGPTEDAVMAAAIEAGAEEVVEHGADGFEIRTHPGDVHGVHDALARAFRVGPERLTYLPKETVRLAEPDKARSVLRLIELLEELGEVQAVHANLEPDEALLAELR
jgi:YebC/PmpR family DNA-binding regulatory protein